MKKSFELYVEWANHLLINMNDNNFDMRQLKKLKKVITNFTVLAKWYETLT